MGRGEASSRREPGTFGGRVLGEMDRRIHRRPPDVAGPVKLARFAPRRRGAGPGSPTASTETSAEIVGSFSVPAPAPGAPRGVPGRRCLLAAGNLSSLAARLGDLIDWCLGIPRGGY
jgi:hypothetical protein